MGKGRLFVTGEKDKGHRFTRYGRLVLDKKKFFNSSKVKTLLEKRLEKIKTDKVETNESV
jgi:hypothetical protein